MISKSTKNLIDFYDKVAKEEFIYSKKVPKFSAPELNNETALIFRNLCSHLIASKKFEAALDLSKILIGAAPGNAFISKMLARAYIANKKFDEAQKICNQFTHMMKIDPVWKMIEGSVVIGLKDLEKFEKIVKEFANFFPYFVIPNTEHQKPEICVTILSPVHVTDDASLHNLRFGGNFCRQFVARTQDKFRFSSLYVDANPIANVLAKIKKPNLIFNAVVNSEILGDPRILERSTKCIDHFDVPVINHPKYAKETARDKLEKALRGNTNFVVPNVEYTILKEGASLDDIIKKLEQKFEYPMILRTPFYQNGIGMFLSKNFQDSKHFLQNMPTTGFYTIEFIENRTKEGHYRKLRVAYVGDNLHFLRCDHGTNWMIHGHREKPHRVKFYNENPHLLKQEINITENPRDFFGKNTFAALKSLRKKIKMEIFGFDFDVTDTGKVIVYEANLSMNLLSRSNLIIPYPQKAGERLLKDAIKYIERKLQIS